MKESELIEHLESLMQEGIINETMKDGEIEYRFTHQKLREYCYGKQSAAKQRMLHRRIAENLEKKLSFSRKDRLMLSKLIYHFERAGENKKALQYSIQNLRNYVDFSHELFPVLEEKKDLVEHPYYLSKAQIYEELYNMERLLEKGEKQAVSTKDLYKEAMDYYYIRGRYLIRRGEYEEGLEDLQYIISRAKEKKDLRNLIKAYKQKVYYSIQTYQLETMKKYIDQGFACLKEYPYPKEEAVFYRLLGLYYMMDGNYEQGDETLRYSIRLFQQISQEGQKYQLNIAAGYSYLGEIRRIQMKFFEGLKYFDQAIRICEDHDIYRSLNVFYTKAGQASFDGGDFKRAKTYFAKALMLYGKEDGLWGRAIAEGFMALILFREGRYNESFQCLKNAEAFSEKIQSPYELGVLYRVKSGIKREMMSKRVVPSFYRDFLEMELSYYCRKGIENLRRVEGSYEMHILERLDALVTVES